MLSLFSVADSLRCLRPNLATVLVTGELSAFAKHLTHRPRCFGRLGFLFRRCGRGFVFASLGLLSLNLTRCSLDELCKDNKLELMPLARERAADASKRIVRLSAKNSR